MSKDRDKFAVLHSARRVWAVAAIHGEAARLARLQAALEQRFMPGDRLVYLGNFLGRGPQIRETLDLLLDFRRRLLARPLSFAYDIAYLRGGQEEMWQKLLQIQFAPNPREVLGWMLNQGVGATLAAYGGDPRQAEIAVRDGGARGHPMVERAARRDAGPARPLPAHGGAAPRRLYRRSSPALRLGRPRSRAPALGAERQLLVGRDRLLPARPALWRFRPGGPRP